MTDNQLDQIRDDLEQIGDMIRKLTIETTRTTSAINGVWWLIFGLCCGAMAVVFAR
jgi:hypothetical protein